MSGGGNIRVPPHLNLRSKRRACVARDETEMGIFKKILSLSFLRKRKKRRGASASVSSITPLADSLRPQHNIHHSASSSSLPRSLTSNLSVRQRRRNTSPPIFTTPTRLPGRSTVAAHRGQENADATSVSESGKETQIIPHHRENRDSVDALLKSSSQLFKVIANSRSAPNLSHPNWSTTSLTGARIIFPT